MTGREERKLERKKDVCGESRYLKVKSYYLNSLGVEIRPLIAAVTDIP